MRHGTVSVDRGTVGALGSLTSENGPQKGEVVTAIMTDLSKGLAANQSPTHGQRDAAPSGGGLGRRLLVSPNSVGDLPTTPRLGSFPSFTEEASIDIQNDPWSANKRTELVKQTQHVAVNAQFKETEAWYVFAKTFLDAATEQCDPFNDMLFATAQNEIDDAFDAAIQGIDCNPITAQSLKDRCATFAQSVATAREVLIKDLKPSQDYSDQRVSQGFYEAVLVRRYELQAELTTKVSASFDTDKVTLSALSDATPIADLTAQVPMAVDLKTRAAGLREFLNVGLLDEINGIADAHFARTLTAAEAIANTALTDAQTTAQTMIGTQPTTETAAQLTTRMTEFDRAAQAALTAFDTAVGGIPDNPAGQDTRATLERSIARLAEQTRTALQASVSTPLQATRAGIEGRLQDPDTTLVMRQNENRADGEVARKKSATTIQKLARRRIVRAAEPLVKDYGLLAEEAAQAQLLTKISHVAEATKMGTTSSLINMGKLWQNLESKFRDPKKDPVWKYNVSLDTAFDEILKGEMPKYTDEYVHFLRTAIERLNSQAPGGLPAPYKDIAETALERLEHRNAGTPQLCAWAMSANLRLVMSVIETFGDTRAAKVSDSGMGVGDNSIALHEGITLRKEDTTSLTGYSRDHGALWSTLHSGQIDFLQIADLDKKNLPGSMLSASNVKALIEKMATGSILSIDDYVPAAGGQEATLTQAGWASFCVTLGADPTISAFLEAKWPVSDAPILLTELHERLEELLNNEAAYKHLRYLFGRRLEWAYQALVL